MKQGITLLEIEKLQTDRYTTISLTQALKPAFSDWVYVIFCRSYLNFVHIGIKP